MRHTLTWDGWNTWRGEHEAGECGRWALEVAASLALSGDPHPSVVVLDADTGEILAVLGRV